MSFEDLPLATPERERDALDLFPLEMSPEEFAARHAHEFVLFSYDEVRYGHPGLTEWVQRLGDIFFDRNDAPSVRELREKYLTPQEIEAAEHFEEDPL